VADVKPRGYAATAAEFLDVAAEGSDTLAALQGIGYGLLAIVDQLADANDGATETRDQLFEIAMAIDGPARELRGSRVLAAFGRLTRRARPGRVRKAGDVVVSSGPGKSAMVRYADQWLREHPGGVVGVHDLKDVPGADHGGQVVPLDDLRRSQGIVVLDGADVVTVRQALADAVASRRSHKAGCDDCGPDSRCPGSVNDDALLTAYGALWATLPGGDGR